MMTSPSKPKVISENRIEGIKVMYSQELDAFYLWCEDRTEAKHYSDWIGGGKVPVYSTRELRELKDTSYEHKRFVNQAKTIFPGSKVISNG
ncbi:MAG: hypothetical protein AB2L14_25440 [Candidatus Xenobiia bacterium LiM19]